MRKLLFLLFGMIVLVFFNWNIWRAEDVLAHGRQVLVEIGPRDPRSLMQGDYMQFAFTKIAKMDEFCASRQTGTSAGAIFLADQSGIAKFLRPDNGASVGAEDLVFRGTCQKKKFKIKPDSFLFQEGNAQAYQKARYAIFKFKNNYDYLLVSLADEHARAINPEVK